MKTKKFVDPFAEIHKGLKYWRACSLAGCHCRGSEMLHVETPEGTMYGPRPVMEYLLVQAALLSL